MNQNLPLSKKLAPLLMGIVTIVLVLATVFPQSAYAFETEKCTARPNADTGSDVLGGKGTRVTWEGQSNADESVSKLSLTFPENTEFGVDDARVTLLTGDDLMTREKIDYDVVEDGSTVTFNFAEPTVPGGYIRLEVYDVKFPSAGGEMQITASAELADGEVVNIDDVPAITVQSTSLSKQISMSLEEQDWVQQWNSHKFLRLFFNPPILVSSFPIVVQGFLLALGIIVVAFPIAVPFGLLLAFMRMSRFKVFRGIASLYVNVIRGTPTFLQIYIAFFGLPLAGLTLPSFILGVLVLAFNSAAYQCEIFRAGIQSISKGQFEAARSLGMNSHQTMFFVIIPQTVRRVLPTLTNEFILLYKDTSLLAAVGVMEIVMYAKTIVASTGSITPYIVAACFYLVLTIPLAHFVGKLESKLAGNDTGKSSKKDSNGKNGSSSALSGGSDSNDSAISPERLASM